MDCFTAVAGDSSGLLIVPQQAGSFGARGSLYLPRLCSIPEAAEPLAVAAQRLRRASESGAGAGGAAPGGEDMAACAAAAAAQRRRLSGCGDKQRRRRHAHCSSPGSGTQFALDSDSSGHSSSGGSSCSSSSACSDASDGEDEPPDTRAAAQEPAVVELAPDHPAAVLADTWSCSIRHFTDCVPVTASLAAHHSSCSSSGDACAEHRPASSCSSGRPAEQQRRGQPGSSSETPPLLEELALHGLDACEWQPWDRVARWLDGHNSSTAGRGGGGAAAAAASPAAASDMAVLLAPHLRHGPAADQQQTAGAAAPAGPTKSSSSASSRSRHKQQQGGAEQQPHEQPENEGAEFDAPDWWQASVVARLEEQREAFHGSWWSRLKMMTGLAA